MERLKIHIQHHLKGSGILFGRRNNDVIEKMEIAYKSDSQFRTAWVVRNFGISHSMTKLVQNYHRCHPWPLLKWLQTGTTANPNSAVMSAWASAIFDPCYFQSALRAGVGCGDVTALSRFIFDPMCHPHFTG